MNQSLPTVTLVPITTEPLLDFLGRTVTGLTDVKMKVRRDYDGKIFDWSDDTFKTDPVQLYATMAEVDATHFPGEYTADFDFAAVTNPFANDVYFFTIVQDGGQAANMPQTGEIRIEKALDEAIRARKLLQNKQRLQNGSLNNLVLYDDDGTTILQRWNVKDKDALGILLSTAVPALREPT